MAHQHSRRRLPSWKGAAFISVIVAVALIAGFSREPPVSELMVGAERALLDSDADRVETLVRQVPSDSDKWQAAQLLAGEAVTKAGRFEAALDYYVAAADHDATTPDGLLAQYSAAEIYLELGRLTQAEQLYRQVLQSQPGNGSANERMAFLLSMTGRRWQALDHYFVLIMGDAAGYRELALAADVGRAVEQAEFLEKCRKQSSDDQLLQLAMATHAFDDGETDALELLNKLVDAIPDSVAAQAMLGEMLVEARSETVFLDWHRSLPLEADQSPDIWFVRGLWARKHSDLKVARDCFWQTVIRTPFHRRAFYVLGQVLLALDDPQGKQIADYAQLLVRLTQSIDKVLFSEGTDENAFQETTELLEQLGRTWEACAWSVVAGRSFPAANWPSELLSRNGHKLNRTLPRIEVAKNPVANRQPSDVPEFDRLFEKVLRNLETGGNQSKPGQVAAGEIRFESVDLISFQYFNSEDPNTKGKRTFEQTGGGVAILDFDADGYPDVFLPQGTVWKTGDSLPSPSNDYSDKLFRNMMGERFVDASSALQGPDSGFGQGCSAADFNNDGFTDLYVANIGRNCLYQNMGDGTFQNVTDSAGITDESWTVSTLVADLNADGLPDIFDANYLMGKDLFRMICGGKACSPSVFPGAPDRLLINQGDGQFVEVADATPRVDSKGLGVVAFELQPDRRPKVFVANDQVANFFLDNQPSAGPHNITLSNHANTTGLAFNDDGVPMACMGIAVDDFNGDNQLDLLVTNFHDEANTLYLQDSPGLFGDATKAAGLEAASLPFTSWGTQSLDADLDGWPDIVIANGQVDDLRDEGRDYLMRPQFFQNRGGQFEELMPEQTGQWFARKFLSRGLARVDWNLDGLPEFIVSNMNSPLGLLKNVSTNTGNFLKVRLIATQSARDAIGARVSIQLGDRSVTRQLVAGDGYMASNERILHFGLGRVSQIDRVTISWPSGTVSELSSLPSDSSLTVVEGSDAAALYGLSRAESLSVVVTAEGRP